MIVSIVARFQGHGEREVDRYAAWQSALQRLRDDWQAARQSEIWQLENYLPDVPESQRAGAMEDLVAEHLRLTWQAGVGRPLEQYFESLRDSFPALASAETIPATLVEDEFLARYQSPHGDTPTLPEFRRRFPGRADVFALLGHRFLAAGRYVLLHKLGLGEMGEVWRAYDTQLRREVAVKRPRAAHISNGESRRRFAAEAALTAGLEHPGIASVHEFHEGAEPFYVMRLVNGRPFGERIRDYHQAPADQSRKDRRLQRHQLLNSFVAVCDAVAFAHARGIIHRDLKPGNVVAGDHGDTVILDWGMAKRFADAEPDARPIVGTPEYMPPEQADGNADTRSDVFGLGAILFELLTTRFPQPWPEGSRPADWRRMVREARIPHPSQLKADTPRALEAICLKALAHSPADRYQSADELAREVRSYLAGEPVTALARSFWSRWRG
ncbi:MAG: serine/threonine-protein kinase [Verrucomicrobiota bacterium]